MVCEGNCFRVMVELLVLHLTIRRETVRIIIFNRFKIEESAHGGRVWNLTQLSRHVVSGQKQLSANLGVCI